MRHLARASGEDGERHDDTVHRLGGPCRRHRACGLQRPGLYGPLVGREAERYARNKVLDIAKSDGANTVVFDPVIPGEPVYQLSAKAYRC